VGASSAPSGRRWESRSRGRPNRKPAACTTTSTIRLNKWCGCGWYLCPDLHTAIDFAHRCNALARRPPDAPQWASSIVYAQVRAYGKALPSREYIDPAGTVRVGGRLAIVGPLYAPAATVEQIRNLPLLRTTKVRPLEELTMSMQAGSP
jgi:hypothetical protein